MNTLPENARIGIWGFGLMGKSAANYFTSEGYIVGIMDKKNLNNDEREYLSKKNINYFDEQEKETFFSSYDFIFSSQGVNIGSHYATSSAKWYTELDFFHSTFKKPIIAITGSFGKTSVTTILASILEKAGLSLCVGGNIGIPTFDLLNKQNSVDLAVLEVSSAQLEHCNNFAPQLAIVTNIHPNHLDFHSSYQAYFDAKIKIIVNQTYNQLTLIPLELCLTLSFKKPVSFFSITIPTKDELKKVQPHDTIYFLKNNEVVRLTNSEYKTVLSLDTISSFSFMHNLLIVTSACDLLNIDPAILISAAPSITLPHHRLEKINTTGLIDFYNDSKATVPASTLAAIEKLHNRPIHLFLGGLSKGINRAPFISKLNQQIKQIYCFGKEAQFLHETCKQNNLASQQFNTLDEAFNNCITYIKPGDQVLLSPSGSSYDLYKNYEERGTHFKNLVTEFLKKNNV